MNWLALILAFGFSAMMAGFFVKLTARSRPAWSPRRRLWTAALILPCFIAALTLFVLIEKIGPAGTIVARLVGAVMVVFGVLFVAGVV